MHANLRHVHLNRRRHRVRCAIFLFRTEETTWFHPDNRARNYWCSLGFSVVGFVEKNQLADPVSMVVGAIIVLFIWDRLGAYGLVREPGAGR